MTINFFKIFQNTLIVCTQVNKIDWRAFKTSGLLHLGKKGRLPLIYKMLIFLNFDFNKIELQMYLDINNVKLYAYLMSSST